MFGTTRILTIVARKPGPGYRIDKSTWVEDGHFWEHAMGREVFTTLEDARRSLPRGFSGPFELGDKAIGGSNVEGWMGDA